MHVTYSLSLSLSLSLSHTHTHITQVLQADLKASKEDVDQLSDLLKTTLSGKSALEERVEQLMMELEDCKETVEHLNVVISEHEFLSSHTDSEHHQHAAALASKVKTLEASLEQHELSAAEHARAREQETEREREGEGSLRAEH